MSNNLPLTEARKNLSEIINQAYYEGQVFSISKGKKNMGVLIGAKEWRKIIETIEMHDQGLADTLAIMVDPKLQEFLRKGEEEIKKGNVVSLDEV